MEHSLHVTHIKIKRSQLYLTIQLPRPDMKIQAELFYQNSSQNFRHQLRCVSRNPQNLIFQIDVSVLEPGENDWNLRLYSDDCPDSWMPVIGSRLLHAAYSRQLLCKKRHMSVFPDGEYRASFYPAEPSTAVIRQSSFSF